MAGLRVGVLQQRRQRRDRPAIADGAQGPRRLFTNGGFAILQRIDQRRNRDVGVERAQRPRALLSDGRLSVVQRSARGAARRRDFPARRVPMRRSSARSRPGAFSARVKRIVRGTPDRHQRGRGLFAGRRRVGDAGVPSPVRSPQTLPSTGDPSPSSATSCGSAKAALLPNSRRSHAARARAAGSGEASPAAFVRASPWNGARAIAPAMITAIITESSCRGIPWD